MNKELTILSIDTVYHNLTKKAIEKTLEVTKANKVVILSDKDILPGSYWFKIDPLDMNGYNKIIFNQLHQYIDTDYFMIVQHDGMPINAHLWNNDFLKYDYIGAPWPWLPKNKNIGNGGFSIRSRKLTEYCKDLPLTSHNEDINICQIYRPYLEESGISFAPTELAEKFSKEYNNGYFDTFGFHGVACLPFYLDDAYLEYYIDNMYDSMFHLDYYCRLLIQLFRSGKYGHVKQLLYRSEIVHPTFKKQILDFVTLHSSVYTDIRIEEIFNLSKY